MLAKFLLITSEISRWPAGVVDMDAAMLVLIQHGKACWGSCLAVLGKRIVFQQKGGVGIAPVPLFGAGTFLTFDQWNSHLVSQVGC